MPNYHINHVAKMKAIFKEAQGTFQFGFDRQPPIIPKGWEINLVNFRYMETQMFTSQASSFDAHQTGTNVDILENEILLVCTGYSKSLPLGYEDLP